MPIPAPEKLTARSADGWHRCWVPYVRLTRLSHHEQNLGHWPRHWELGTWHWHSSSGAEVAGAEHWLGLRRLRVVGGRLLI